MECRKILTSKMLRPPPRRVPRPTSIGTDESSSGTKRKQMDQTLSKPKPFPITTPRAPILKPEKLKSQIPPTTPRTPIFKPVKLMSQVPPTTPKTPIFKPDKPMSQIPKTTPRVPISKPDKVKPVMKPNKKGSNQKLSKMLLAGCMAHEFLTKGTLLGRKFGESSSTQKETQEHKNQRYMELSLLLKTEEAHIPGIFNPTQLAQFLKL